MRTEKAIKTYFIFIAIIFSSLLFLGCSEPDYLSNYPYPITHYDDTTSNISYPYSLTIEEGESFYHGHSGIDVYFDFVIENYNIPGRHKAFIRLIYTNSGYTRDIEYYTDSGTISIPTENESCFSFKFSNLVKVNDKYRIQCTINRCYRW